MRGTEAAAAAKPKSARQAATAAKKASMAPTQPQHQPPPNAANGGMPINPGGIPLNPVQAAAAAAQATQPPGAPQPPAAQQPNQPQPPQTNNTIQMGMGLAQQMAQQGAAAMNPQAGAMQALPLLGGGALVTGGAAAGGGEQGILLSQAEFQEMMARNRQSDRERQEDKERLAAQEERLAVIQAELVTVKTAQKSQSANSAAQLGTQKSMEAKDAQPDFRNHFILALRTNLASTVHSSSTKIGWALDAITNADLSDEAKDIALTSIKRENGKINRLAALALKANHAVKSLSAQECATVADNIYAQDRGAASAVPTVKDESNPRAEELLAPLSDMTSRV